MGFTKSTASKVGGFFRQQGWVEKKTKTDYRNCDVPFTRWFSETNISLQITKTEEIKVEQSKAKSSNEKQTKGKRKAKSKTGVKKVKKVYTITRKVIYCNDIDKMLEEHQLTHVPGKLRLFLDADLESFKAVLLDNTVDKDERYSGLLVAYSERLPEIYEAVQQVFELINYSKYQWKVSCDFKLIAVISGMKPGFCKYQCYLCNFQPRLTQLHFTNHRWTSATTENTFIGERSIVKPPLVPPENIILPDLHIRLGICTQIIKAMDKKKNGYKYLSIKFPRLSAEKIEAGILNGPQIKALFRDNKFWSSLESTELSAWKCFDDVCSNFLGNNRSSNYRAKVNSLLLALKTLGASESLKVHILESHLDKFSEHIGAVSDQMGEQYHQVVKQTKKHNKRAVSSRMIGILHFRSQVASKVSPNLKNVKVSPPTPPQLHSTFKLTDLLENDYNSEEDGDLMDLT